MTTLGSATPRVHTPPLRELTPETSLGFSVIQFAEDILGETLLPWQEWFLIHALELNEDGTLRFKTVLLMVARQNGKTHLVKILILWRLFVMQAALVIGAAQSLGDAEDVWEEVVRQAEDIPLLAERITRVSWVNGGKKMRLSTGGIYMVETLQRDAGRGKTADLVFLDELREHKTPVAWNALAATTLVPKMSQNICASNAGDAQSVVLNQMQDKASNAIETGRTDSTSVALFEWSAEPDCDINDRDQWVLANPALGHTLTEAAIQAAQDSMTEAGFRTEHLCQRVQSIETGVIPYEIWRDQADLQAQHADPVHLALDVAWDRSAATLAVASRSADGRYLVEVVAHRSGVDWISPWLSERLEGTWWDGRLALQARGAPVSALKDELVSIGVEVVEWGGPELSAGTGRFFDYIVAGKLRHLAQPVLDSAARVAKSKVSGDAWWFDRKNSPADISALIACCAAVWSADQPREEPRESAYADSEYEMVVV